MEIDISALIFLALATFRITHLVVFDRVAEPVRKPFFTEVTQGDEIYWTPKNKIGELISCYWCTGFWVSVLLYTLTVLMPDITQPVVIIFAVAGLAAILEGVGNHD